MERTKERLTGFASGEKSEVISYDSDTNATTVKVVAELANKKVTTLNNGFG